MDRIATSLLLGVLFVGCSKQDGDAAATGAAVSVAPARPEAGADGPGDTPSATPGATHNGDASPGQVDAPGAGGHTRGVAWHEGTFAAALNSARAEGKQLFVDVGAAWCPPCQELHATAFRDPAIQRAIAARFVPLSIDADVAEGPELVQWFGVASYPTLLRLDAAGNIESQLDGTFDTATLQSWLSAPTLSARDVLDAARARWLEAPERAGPIRRFGLARFTLGTAAERVEGAAMLRARFGDATQEMFEVLKLWEGSAVARAQARRDLDARMREVIDDAARVRGLRRRAELAMPDEVAARSALTRLRALPGDDGLAGWTCAQLSLSPAFCLDLLPLPAEDRLMDAATAALEARLAAAAGDAARAAAAAARARQLAPEVVAYGSLGTGDGVDR